MRLVRAGGWTGALLCAALLGLAGCSGSGGQGAGGSGTKTGEAPVDKPAQEKTEAGAEAPEGGPKKVYLATIVDHPALNDARDGVIEKLGELGWTRDVNIVYKTNSAQGNPSIAGQIAKQFVSEDPDVIVAIATPVAQSMVAATTSIPIVFAAVTDPVEAKLVKSWDRSENNVTGVSDSMPLEDQVNLVMKLVPGKKRVGYVYSPGEVNSTVILERLKDMLPKKGMELVPAPAQRTTDIPAAALSLSGKVDIIYSSLDNNVTSAYESLFQAAKEMKVPIVSADTANVPRGAVAALGVNYKQIGLKAGEMVDAILRGAKPTDISSESMSELDLHLSVKNAKALGFAIPDALLGQADFIDGKPGPKLSGGEALAADHEETAPAPAAEPEPEPAASVGDAAETASEANEEAKPEPEAAAPSESSEADAPAAAKPEEEAAKQGLELAEEAESVQ